MQRHRCNPRPDWRPKVEQVGLERDELGGCGKAAVGGKRTHALIILFHI